MGIWALIFSEMAFFNLVKNPSLWPSDETLKRTRNESKSLSKRSKFADAPNRLLNWTRLKMRKVMTVVNQENFVNAIQNLGYHDRSIRTKENITRSRWQLRWTTSQLLKAREIAGDQVEIDLSSHLIGCESGASFLNQSNSEGKQNHCNPNTIETRSI